MENGYKIETNYTSHDTEDIQNVFGGNSIIDVIADLLIDPEDPDNPHPEHNAYNWGLLHAQMVLRGVPVGAIKQLQPK